MKTFFASKIYYLLILLLVGTLGLAGFLGYAYLNASKTITVPDFLGKNKEEVFEWCGQLSEEYACEILYEESKSVEKDLVFQQSLNAGSALKDKITIHISSELIKPVTLPQLYEAKRSDIEKWQSDNGILNVNYVDESSDTIAKGTVIRLEPSGSIYKDTPVTVYISSGRALDPNQPIEVKSGEYTGLSQTAFESQAKTLGLAPNHNTSKDAYSDSIAKGNVVWHGSGSYTNGETINYGLSLGKNSSSSSDIIVKAGDFVGYTEENFKQKATDLGLKANHNASKDAYSDTVAKGSVVWHGSGTYVKNETFNYGLSLGKKDGSSSSEIVVKQGAYIAYTEENFKKTASDLGLVATHVKDRDAYSDTVAKGSIVTHGYGTYEKGEAFNYGLSLGKEGVPSTVTVSAGKYVGLTEEEFKKTAVSLGLIPTHKKSADDYSDTVAKGSVIWHGSGTYNTNDSTDPFNYSLSLGKSDGSSSGASDDEIVVKSGAYVGYTEENFIKKATELGLVATHVSSRDAYSDTIAKGSIVTHGYGVYEKNEAFNYGLSLGKKDGSSSDEIVVKQNAYVAYTEDNFIKTANSLGLKPNHKSEKDAYSDTVAKGSIVWHGYGTYEKNETFNYGLSLGKKADSSIYVNSGAYVGKSESEFQKIATNLGLKANHSTSRDTYSDTVAKGYIVWHGSGTYVSGETFNYGLSLGKSSDGKVTVSDKSGSTESSFKSYIEGLGLVLGTRSTAYSDSIKEGYLISNDTGSFSKGSKVNYTVSLGKKTEATGYVMRPEKYQVSDTYDATKSAMQSYLSVFTNVEYIGVSSNKGVGRLERIEVGDYGSTYSADYYPVSTPIKVYIVNKQTN